LTLLGVSYILPIIINKQERYKMQTQTQILESKVELMTRINKLLELMNTMQDNMGIMAKRLVALEEKVNNKK